MWCRCRYRTSTACWPSSATITFDSSVIQLQDVAVGDLTYGWALESDSPNANTVNIALASSTSVSGNGDIARLTFDVVGAATSQSPLTISNAQINGTDVEDISQGTFTVNGYHSLAGTVSYYGGGSVPGAALNLVGVGPHQTTSGSDGSFLLDNLQTGAYTLTPSKSNDVNEITAYDASLVLQAVAGSRTLSTNETIAANVDRLGGVTALDASYILQKSVGLIDVPFPGAGRVWDFLPSQRTYADLNGDLSGQDFTAILLGDTSANWTPPASGCALFDMLEGEARLAIPVVEGSQSQQVVLPVEIQRAGESIHSVDLAIIYDAQELLLVGVQFGPAAAGLATAFNPVGDSEILIGMASGSAFAKDGTLVNLCFDVIGSLESPTTVTIASARLDEGNIAVVTQDGAVQETVVENPLPGDANRDGTVNQADAAIVSANWLMSSGAGWADGDFNGDGRVNEIDSTLMAANWQQTVSPPATSASVAIEPEVEAVSYDLDNNGCIGLGDLAIFASVYREMPGITTENPYAYAADFDGSGTVDLGDLAIFAANFHAGLQNSATAPQTTPTMAEAPASLSTVLPANLPGDANNDGMVDNEDAATLALHWHKQAAATWAEGDFNADGLVDDLDAAILAQHWLMSRESMNDDAHKLVFDSLGKADHMLKLE